MNKISTNSGLYVRLDAVAAEASQAQSADPAHDILHVRRVARTAHILAQAEGANEMVVVCAAVLHELFSYPKNDPRSPQSGQECAKRAARVLETEGAGEDVRNAVAYCIAVHPFSLSVLPDTLEARVLQDADRLDAIGAVGIARCFSSGAVMGRPFYEETDPFCLDRAPDDKEYTLDHFFRKLFKLESGFHTQAARELAHERTNFLREYLNQFANEIGSDAPTP